MTRNKDSNMYLNFHSKVLCMKEIVMKKADDWRKVYELYSSYLMKTFT
jgi:hypothetical protein